GVRLARGVALREPVSRHDRARRRHRAGVPIEPGRCRAPPRSRSGAARCNLRRHRVSYRKQEEFVMKLGNCAKTMAAGALLALTVGGAKAFAAGNAKVCFEAENFVSVQKPLRKVLAGPSHDYSGKGYLDIPWDRNLTKGIGEATYTVNVKTPGAYYLW